MQIRQPHTHIWAIGTVENELAPALFKFPIDDVDPEHLELLKMLYEEEACRQAMHAALLWLLGDPKNTSIDGAIDRWRLHLERFDNYTPTLAAAAGEVAGRYRFAYSRAT